MPPVVIAIGVGAVAVDVATGGGVQKAAGEVIKAGGKVVDKVVDVGRAIAKDPLPVIATVALSAVGVPPPIASAAVTAAQGGSPKDIAVAAVAAGVGGKVGGSVGGAVGGSAMGKSVAAATGTSIETVSKIAASASGASSATVTARVLQGQPLDQALKEGLVAGAGGAVGEAASIGAQNLLPVQNRTAQGFIAGTAGGGAQAAVTGQDIGTGAILSGISTAGATALGDYRAKQEADNLARAQSFLARNPTAELTEASLPGYQATKLDVPYRSSTGELVESRLEPIEVTGKRELISPILQPTAFQPSKAKQTRGVVVSATNTNAMVMKPSGDVVQINTGGTPLKPSMAVNIDETTNTLVREPTDTGIREDIATEDEARRLGEVEVTGERPIDRLPAVDVSGEETVSQRFPLTEPDKTGTKRPLINYMYANVDPVLQRSVGGGGGGGMPSSTALAQALGVGDPGALYLGKKGKERRPVWNVESLKLRDELGGDYG
jgi:hypothetical protein